MHPYCRKTKNKAIVVHTTGRKKSQMVLISKPVRQKVSPLSLLHEYLAKITEQSQKLNQIVWLHRFCYIFTQMKIKA